MTVSRRAQLQAVRGRALSDPVARNSAFIVLSTVATSGLGDLFWLIVDHTTTAAVSGQGAAVISALQATALLASVGAAAAMVEWLPRAGDALVWRQRLSVGLIVATVSGLVGGLLVATALAAGASRFPSLRHPEGFALFVVGAVCFAVGTVLDYVAIAEGRSGVMLVRNIAFNGLRTPLLFVPVVGGRGANAVLASWAVAAVLSMVVAVLALDRGPARDSGHRIRPLIGAIRTQTREMASSLVGQHLITITAMLVAYLLPILIAIRLSAADAAYFYATWMLGSVFFIISPAVSTALFAAGAAGRAEMGALARRASRIIALLLALPIVVYVIGGGLLLRLFGADYAHHGRALLLVLTVSAVPDAVTNVAVAILRASHRLRQALWLNGSMLVGAMVLAWAGAPRFGIIAAGVAWLASQTVGALWVVIAWRRIVAGATLPDLPPESAASPDLVAMAPSP